MQRLLLPMPCKSWGNLKPEMGYQVAHNFVVHRWPTKIDEKLFIVD